METECFLSVLGQSNWELVVSNKSTNIDLENVTMKQTKQSCKICGDKGIGFNFGVQTCESCKAFFRRNALLKKEFKCPFENCCEITTKTRKYCQKCRLNKCFLVGMRKNLILRNKERRQKNESNEYLNIDHNQFSLQPTWDSIQILPNPNEVPIMINQENYLLIDFFDYFYKRDVELLINKINNSIPINHPYEQFMNFVCNKMVHCELLYNIENNTKVDPINELNVRLEELNAACSAILIKYSKVEDENFDIFNAFKASECQLIKLINMAKMMKTFQKLSIADQIVMLKSNIKEMLILFDVFLFDAEQDCSIYYNDETQTGIKISYKLCDQVFGQQISNMFKEYVIKSQQLINNEYNLLYLLLAIALYKPSDSLASKDLIRKEYLACIEALKVYLRRSCVDKCQAQTKYIKLMMKFEEMYLLSPIMFKCFDNIDTSKLTHFFREVFGIDS